MSLFAVTDLNPVGQIAAAVLLGAAGVFFLLPKPRGRSVAAGTFLSLAAAVAAGVFVLGTFGRPTADFVGQALFWLFTVGAVGFGVVLVAQRNPARGAIAFAFVILSTCGQFLLLAAPFLMAATIIVYAGAIIVTFLFVLMLSHTEGSSDENDRTREPLLGSLAGFAFAGLVLFALYLSSPASAADGIPRPLPAPPLTDADHADLAAASDYLATATQTNDARELGRLVREARLRLGQVVGYASGETPPPGGDGLPRPTVQERLRPAETDARAWQVIGEADRLRNQARDTSDRLENNLLGPNPNLDAVRQDVRSLWEQTLLLHGRGELSSRNVSAVGYALYSEHLIAVEMAGTLLLVATIGAVAIAHRRREGVA
jgi:NADH:ubiquinone oxidoreductase subunit 6 (subunit J)